MDYGFTMVVSDLTSAQMKKIEQSIKGVSNTIKTETSTMSDNFGKLGQSAQQMGRYVVEAFSVYEIYNFGKELLNVAMEFQNFTNVIKYSSTGTVDNAENINYLNDAITRLHLPMKQAFEQFSEMQAGMVGTGIQGDKLRKVFEGVAEASTVMHLNADKFSRTTYALKEIGELGTVQARQMRMLAIALPGAMSIASKSLGMTSEQFHKAMKGGKINSADFLPKFAEGLTKRFEGGLKNAGQSLMAQMNDAKNSILTLMLDMGTKLEPLFLDIMHTVKYAMEEIRDVWSGLTANSAFVETLKFIFDWAVKIIPIWATYKVVMAGWNAGVALNAYITRLFSGELVANSVAATTNAAAMGIARVEVSGFGASMVTTTAEVEAATGAITMLEAALTTFAVGGAIFGLGLLIEKLISLNKESKDFVDTATRVKMVEGIGSQAKDMFADLSNRYADYGHSGDKADKEVLLKDLMESKTFLEDKLKKSITPALLNANKMAATSNKILGYHDESSGQGQHIKVPDYAEIDPTKRSQAIVDQQKEQKSQDEMVKTLKSIGLMINNLAVNQGIIAAKPEDFGKDGKSSTENAINTSNLSGASGGLGQAKQIHITIGVVQQNNGVKESKNESEQAVLKIIEMINGFSDSQNSI